MLQHRIWPLLGLSIIAPGVFQPAWSDSANGGRSQSPAYICQFGDTVRAYAFQANASGQLEGVGPMQGWSAVPQPGGLVARTTGQLLIIGDGPDSLLQDGQLVQGDCSDAAGEIAQQLADGNPGAPPPAMRVPDPNDLQSAPPLAADDAMAMGMQAGVSDDWLAGVLDVLDPQVWESAKVEAIVDALSLDNATKLGIKAAILSAGNDPARIRDVARQVQRAIGMEVARAIDLRARLQEAKRDLKATSAALDDQHQRVQIMSTQLANAQAKAADAEKARTQTAALLVGAQRALGQKDAELGKFAQDMNALNHHLVVVQQQAASLQAALDATAQEQQKANFQIGSLTEQLALARARLARANIRIDELKAGRN